VLAGTPSSVGARAELAVATALTRAGMTVFVPFFAAHSRVDLVAHDGVRLRRVQCKSCTRRGDVLTFRTSSNTGGVSKHYRGDIDDFGIYSPELDRVYLVPVELMPSARGCLRIGPPLNNQRKGVHFASDFEVRFR
jgi:hypothetical protein